MFCDYCGTQLRENAKFCHACGAEQLPEAASEVKEQEGFDAQPESQSADNPAQPLCGTYSWENVKISGEFKNGVGTLTITFS